MSLRIAATATFTAAVLLATALAHADSARDSREGRRGPPQEALTACEALAVDTACSFVGRQSETVTGICLAPPRGQSEVLACVPDSHRQRQHGNREARPDAEAS